MAALGGQFEAGGLADLGEFYDNVYLEWLIRAAVAMDFPMAPLFLAKEVDMRARPLQTPGQVATAVQATSGILPGHPAAVSWARAVLYLILLALTKNHPKLSIRQYVDDMRLRSLAQTTSDAARGAATGMVWRTSGLIELGCEVSLSETKLLASRTCVGRELARRGKNKGQSDTLADHESDLGIDTSLSNQSRGKARVRARRAGAPIRANNQAQKIVLPRVGAGSKLGTSVAGVSFFTLGRHRRIWLRGAGVKDHLCPVGTCRLLWPSARDPMIFEPLALMEKWLGILSRKPRLQQVVMRSRSRQRCARRA